MLWREMVQWRAGRIASTAVMLTGVVAGVVACCDAELPSGIKGMAGGYLHCLHQVRVLKLCTCGRNGVWQN